MQNDIENILEGCAKNSRKSQKQLYDLFSEKLYGIALSYTAHKEDAQDILHDSFIKIYDNLQKKEIDHKKLEGWMRRIVVNTAIDFLRRKKRITFSDEIYEVKPENQIKNISNANDITALLQLIPNGARTVFNLYVVEGYSHKEIAEILNVTESTSKTQYHRAKKLMRALVDKFYQKV